MKKIFLSTIIEFFLFSSFLLFSDTNLWEGKSSDWFDKENWSMKKVPDKNDNNDVLIPSGKLNYPKLTSDVFIDGTLTIEKGASIQLNGYNITLVNLGVNNKKGIVNKGIINAEKNGSILTVGRGGFINEGEVKGYPSLVFGTYSFDALLKAGGANFSSITISPGSYSYRVTAVDKLVIKGNLVLQGHSLYVNKNASVYIYGDIIFEGKSPRTAGMTLEGDVFLYGNIVSNDSSIGNGNGNGWIIFNKDGLQEINILKEGGILPPIKIEKKEGIVKLTGNLSCAGLYIEEKNALLLNNTEKIQFGGAGSESAYTRGLINKGKIQGKTDLNFSTGCYNADLLQGDFEIQNLKIDTGNYAYSVNLKENLKVNGDIDFKTGTLNMGENAITVGGSWYFSPFPEKPSPVTPVLQSGKNAKIIFTSNSNAIIQSGGVEKAHYYDATFPNLIINKPEGILIIKEKPLEVKGMLKLENGKIEMKDGGEIYLGVVRDQTYGKYRIFDIGLKLKGTLTKEMFPEIVPAKIPEPTPGKVRIIHNYVGPDISSKELFNIAPFANITTIPYTTIVKNLIDNDPDLRTLTLPETGTPAKFSRYQFQFKEKQKISRISWCVASGPWAILADKDGDGNCETLLRIDIEGKVENPGGTWVSRSFLHNNFVPPVETYGIMYVDFSGKNNIYDFQILISDKKDYDKLKKDFEYEKEKGVPIVEDGEEINVPAPSEKERIFTGFHIEPWMFNLPQWIKMDKDKRPSLNEYKGFRDFVEGVKNYKGNILNMWPPTTWEQVGPGTYEHPVLWPSEYDRHSAKENFLEEVVEAFHKEGLKLFTMRRVAYPKKLEEFPKTPTRDKPAPYISRHSREYLNGIVREQVLSGVDGVGIGFDEQMPYRTILNLKGVNEVTKSIFKEKYKCELPEEPQDTEAFRKWIVFGYEEFANYLADAANEAKKIRPSVYTKSPVHFTLGTLWNSRIDVGIAEDIVGNKARIDFARGNSYLTFQSLGHYVTVLSAKIGVGANENGGVVSLHNCSWSWRDDTLNVHPGFYLHFPPVYMRASPISSVLNGARMTLFWRYNLIFFGNYDKYVKEGYSIIETMSSWGAKEAKTPKYIAILRSRTSEDWWQVKQRYNEKGDPMDQIRGYIYLKYVMEFLLRNGYPFDVYYLDHPVENLRKKLDGYKLFILPFPYSISKETFNLIKEFMEKGVGVILFDRTGETDEWGNLYEKGLFEDLIKEKKVLFINEDIPKIGHHPDFIKSLGQKIDETLGREKTFYFNSYGEDVEFGILENKNKEYILTFINWTDKPVEVDFGLLKLPQTKNYEILQRDLNGTKRVKIGNKELLKGMDLKKIRIALDKWDVKVLYVK
ncbi:MAG TPA: hypothetical protein PKV21_01060 [bacterium]|nr:hypothetical protein [bacterium]HOM26077.1 hypothetical protein [bacterium]